MTSVAVAIFFDIACTFQNWTSTEDCKRLRHQPISTFEEFAIDDRSSLVYFVSSKRKGSYVCFVFNKYHRVLQRSIYRDAPFNKWNGPTAGGRRSPYRFWLGERVVAGTQTFSPRDCEINDSNPMALWLKKYDSYIRTVLPDHEIRRNGLTGSSPASLSILRNDCLAIEPVWLPKRLGWTWNENKKEQYIRVWCKCNYVYKGGISKVSCPWFSVTLKHFTT